MAAVAPDGAWLATVGGHKDGTVRIWDTATGQRRATLTGAFASAYDVVAAPDGIRLATIDNNGTVQIWDTTTGQQLAVIRDIPGHSRFSAAERVAIGWDDASVAIAGEDGTVRIWDTASGYKETGVAGHVRVRAFAVAPDGTWLATGDRDGRVRIWDTATGQQRAAPDDQIDTVVIASDGIWRADVGGDERARDPASSQEEPDPGVDAVAVAPDGTWLATDGRDGRVRIWDTTTGQERAVLSSGQFHGNPLAIAPDGSWYTGIGQDRRMRIWDTATGRERGTLPIRAFWLGSVAPAPNSTWLATASSVYGSVRIWDAITGRQRLSLTPHARPVDVMRVAPDSTWLATFGSDGRVRIWDAATGRQRTALPGHARWHIGWHDDMRNHAIAIAPNGTWLATMDGLRSRSVTAAPTTAGNDRARSGGSRAPSRPAAIAESERLSPCCPDRSADARSDGHMLGPGGLTTGKRLAAPEADAGSPVPSAMTAAEAGSR